MDIVTAVKKCPGCDAPVENIDRSKRTIEYKCGTKLHHPKRDAGFVDILYSKRCDPGEIAAEPITSFMPIMVN